MQYEQASAILTISTILFFGSIWLAASLFLFFRKKKSPASIFLFTLFYFYIFKVLDYTLFQFQSLLLLKYFVPNLILNGFGDGASINLIPLAKLTLQDTKTSLLNILMFVPFGLGLPFFLKLTFRKALLAGFFFSLGIELMQFITGFVAGTAFRVADINDLIFNTAGAAIGYILFIPSFRAYRHLFQNQPVL